MADIVDVVNSNWAPRDRLKPSTTVQAKLAQSAHKKRANIAPPVLDQIQARLRQSEFLQSLQLWREIFRRQDAGLPLTREQEAERDAPRTKFRLDAIAEADNGLLTRTKRMLMKVPETDWAFLMVHPAETDKVMKTMTLTIPLDISKEAILEHISRCVDRERKKLGVIANQLVRRPGVAPVDPWKVYDLVQKNRPNTTERCLLQITHQLFGTSGLPTYNPVVRKQYERVRNAYRYAERVMKALDQQARTKKR
jgi:hypothetical protein